MARLPRFVVAGHVHHVVLQSLPDRPAFVDSGDYGSFIEAFRRSSAEQDVAIHSYALLPHEVHLMVTPSEATALGRMMQALARFYVPAFNRRHGRSGALWSGRYRAAPVGGASPLLTCMLFVEQAPERGGAGPALDYPWSSAGHHAGASAGPLAAAVPAGSAYWQLGNTPFERDAAYAALLAQPLSPQEAAQVERSTVRGWALGSGEFLARLGAESARRSQPKPKGRPKPSAVA